MTIEPIAVVAPVLVEYTETLPRKRMASAVLFHDGHGRQLLVAPVYKEGWELPKAAWADGLNDKLALAQDAKYIKVDSDSSWFIPDTLHPAMAGLAERKMDDRLIKYRDAVESPDNPLRGLEIIVNRPEAAQFIAGRMNALGIPGIVRLRH